MTAGETVILFLLLLSQGAMFIALARLREDIINELKGKL